SRMPSPPAASARHSSAMPASTAHERQCAAKARVDRVVITGFSRCLCYLRRFPGGRMTQDRSVPPRWRNRNALAQAGFSLLELMIVVTIVGIIAASVIISSNVVRPDRDVEREAARLNGLLSLLREEALMQTRDYGVLFAEN